MTDRGGAAAGPDRLGHAARGKIQFPNAPYHRKVDRPYRTAGKGATRFEPDAFFTVPVGTFLQKFRYQLKGFIYCARGCF